MRQDKKLEQLAKHLTGLNLVKFPRDELHYSLPEELIDKTRFCIGTVIFSCGMPACVAGHAEDIFDGFDIKKHYTYFLSFWNYFNLNQEEASHICQPQSYRDYNPSPQTAARHIRQVLDNKFREKENE